MSNKNKPWKEGRIYFQSYHIIILKMFSFQQKVMKHSKKQEKQNKKNYP